MDSPIDLGWRPPPKLVKPAGKGRQRHPLDLELSLDSYSGAPRGPRASSRPLLGLQSNVTNVLHQGSIPGAPAGWPTGRPPCHQSPASEIEGTIISRLRQPIRLGLSRYSTARSALYLTVMREGGGRWHVRPRVLCVLLFPRRKVRRGIFIILAQTPPARKYICKYSVQKAREHDKWCAPSRSRARPAHCVSQ